MMNKYNSIYSYKIMQDNESCDLTLHLKELHLNIKFPCKLYLHHNSRQIIQDIASNDSNIFSIDKVVQLHQEKLKKDIEIVIQLHTDKGGKIMAGVIKINAKQFSKREGDVVSIPLDKCIDPQARCVLMVSGVAIVRSKGSASKVSFEDKHKVKGFMDQSKIQTKSEIPAFEGMKDMRSRLKPNQFQKSKKTHNNVGYSSITPVSRIRGQKALTMVGGVVLKEQEFGGGEKLRRFRKEDKQDNKSYRWREEQLLKSSWENTEKTLKLQVSKYKSKWEESQRNIEQKSKALKNLKDTNSDLSRQLLQKTYLQQQLLSKKQLITKLQQQNKVILKEIHDNKLKFIDFQREKNEMRDNFNHELQKKRDQFDDKEHEFSKILMEKKDTIKEHQDQIGMKNTQIFKIKTIIEELEKTLEIKTFEHQKLLNKQKKQLAGLKQTSQEKQAQLQFQVKQLSEQKEAMTKENRNYQEQVTKMSSKIHRIEQQSTKLEKLLEIETIKSEQLNEAKRKTEKNEEHLSITLKTTIKEFSVKEKQMADESQLSTQTINTQKRKINQLVQKNKHLSTRISQIQLQLNQSVAQCQKIKRASDLQQRELKSLQQNEKIISSKNKIKDDKILQMEKDFIDLEGRSNNKQSVLKKDVEYKQGQIDKFSLKITELETHLQKQKQTRQGQRLQLLKQESKIKMQEESINKLNTVLKQTKQNYLNKQSTLNSTIQDLEQTLKVLELHNKQINKQYDKTQNQKSNQSQQLFKQLKNISSIKEKYEKQTKKCQEQTKNIKQLEIQISDKKTRIIDLDEEIKMYQNQIKKMQADKNKNQKINSIISQQKDVAKIEIMRMKKQIQKRQQKEERQIKQNKELKQYLTKIQIKNGSLKKEYEKLKESISQSLKMNFMKKNSFSSENSLESSRGLKLSRSRNFDSTALYTDINENKFSEIIENYAKEYQSIFNNLNEDAKRQKRQKEKLEKDLSNQNHKSAELQQLSLKQVQKNQEQFVNLTTQMNVQAEEYEERISILERQIHQKHKIINNLTDQLQSVQKIYQNQKITFGMQQNDNFAKIQSLKSKIIELESKDEENINVFVECEQKIQRLQGIKNQLESQIEVLNELIFKLQTGVQEKIETIQSRDNQIEILKKLKVELSTENYSQSQKLSLQKQTIQRLTVQLSGQEQKNMQLTSFNSELLKEKQSLMKKDLQKLENIYKFQQKIASLQVQTRQNTEQLTKKATKINQLKQSYKILSAKYEHSETTNSEILYSIQKEKERIKDKQKKISDKTTEIQQLQEQIKQNNEKYEKQIEDSKKQNDESSSLLTKQRATFSSKLSDLEKQLRKSRQAQRRVTQTNINLQEQVFFAKQSNSINDTKIQHLQSQIISLQTQIQRLSLEITNICQQLKQKDQTLFSISGKLYNSDIKIQQRENLFKSKMGSIEEDYQNRLEEIYEEYEHKIMVNQKEKEYLKKNIEELNEYSQKINREREMLKNDIEKQKEIFEGRIKKIEQQKMSLVISKNKDIQSSKGSVEQLQTKLKYKELQIKNVFDQKKVTLDRLKQMKSEFEKSQEKKNSQIKIFEKEIQSYKRKENQLKKYKQMMKTSQWGIQREMKKSFQNFSKNILTLTEQNQKSQILEMMRNFEINTQKIVYLSVDEGIPEA